MVSPINRFHIKACYTVLRERQPEYYLRTKQKSFTCHGFQYKFDQNWSRVGKGMLFKNIRTVNMIAIISNI